MNKFRKSLCVVLCAVILAVSFLAECAYAAGEAVYCDFEDGVLYVSGDGAMTAVQYANDASVEEIYIERGVTSVPAGAFSGCVNLQKVTMSNSVVSIGTASFEGCISLSELRLSENITAVPESAFSGCVSLEGIKLPALCESIGSGAFGGCSSLEFVIISAGVSFVDSTAFDNCTSLSDVYYAGSEADWYEVNFTGTLSGNMIFLAPGFYVEETFTSGRLALSLKLESGSFNALDVQLAPQGECDIYRIQVSKSYTSSNNRNNGIISMYSDESIAPDDEIVKVTYNVRDCEAYSVNVSFFSCTVEAEGFDIDVPVSGKNFTFDGGHFLSGEWTVTSDPSANGSGAAEAFCDCCGTAIKELPYIFKNCTEENGIAFISSYGLNADEFKTAYLTTDFPELTVCGTYIGTGTAVSADYSDGIVYNYTVSLNGDVDGDGFCNAMDSMIVACICEEILSAESLSVCESFAADCNDDNSFDYADCEYAEQNGIMAISE